MTSLGPILLEFFCPVLEMSGSILAPINSSRFKMRAETRQRCLTRDKLYNWEGLAHFIICGRVVVLSVRLSSHILERITSTSIWD